MKKNQKNILIILFVVIFTACEKKDIFVENLLCDYMEEPLSIESVTPLLKWQLSSDKRAKSQSAYRILVSSDISLLEKDQSDYWDSGKVQSSGSIIRYKGIPLNSKAQVYWKVMVWDETGIPSGWSDIATWTMGLLQPSDWKAKWIGQRVDQFADSTQIFPAPYLRKEFAVAKAVKKAIAYISGLGFYEMYINGEKIGDQVLSPAVTNYDRRSLKNLLYHYDDQSTQRVFYNTFDVTKNLKTENNAIGVILGNGWYNQRDRIVEGYMWYDVPKMILQLEIEYKDGTRETIVSDKSWRVTTGPLVHDAIFTGEVYDARLDLGAWNRKAYEDKTWQPALEVRPPSGKLMAQTVPYTKVMRTVDTTLKNSGDSIYTFTLPETISGWCSINVKGNKGDTLKLRFITEEGYDYGQIDTYILKGGNSETWEPKFTWHTFRRIEIAAKDISISERSVTVKSIYTDVDNTGSFECSNELFNRIHRAWVRTMHANFKGIISSDPHRERLAYTGDGQVISESLLYSFDMTRFLSKFIDDMDDAQNKNTGYVPHTAPFSGGGGGPAWGSAYVIIPWAYFCHYGDISILQKHYSGMKQWVGYLQTRTDERGLVVREEPMGWCLGDWCTPYNRIEIPTEFVNTAFFYHTASTMANVAKVLGKSDDEAAFASLAETIKCNFNKAFYDPSTSHYWKGKQGADAYALAFGLVPEDKRDNVLAAMLKHLESINYHFDTGIFGTPLTLKALTENGREDTAYKLMNQKDFTGYGYLMDDKNSTLWETWDGGGDDPNGSGHCHPMFGSVVAWFYNSLAGIKPDKLNPGMKHFYIEPKPVQDLRYCKASYNSLYGKIISDWSVDKEENFCLKVLIPVNTTATIRFPRWGKNIVFESEIPLEEVSGITVDKKNPNQITVPSGSYYFIVSKY
ncbi:family 78 glycoside hydrolase catalytic domain [Dysgonomonas gadei]|uniref:alpha-L-rhamnosidase n=1 Tax=Dysgonomonas gadei ATCC BAA-286 TaxID=742766 RepID=F5IZD0_9BACT|nr:family 78 glycoside hydrolase catalytic domain [Dysgonomonas gadei]EGK01255.1 hypothetical protein HMPREF9455_02447 [Dysgonomonas gadei ATCC BAA-286]